MEGRPTRLLLRVLVNGGLRAAREERRPYFELGGGLKQGNRMRDLGPEQCLTQLVRGRTGSYDGSIGRWGARCEVAKPIVLPSRVPSPEPRGAPR